jgi:hypothetical protein
MKEVMGFGADQRRTKMLTLILREKTHRGTTTAVLRHRTCRNEPPLSRALAAVCLVRHHHEEGRRCLKGHHGIEDADHRP